MDDRRIDSDARVDVSVQILQPLPQEHERRLGRTGLQEALETTCHATKNRCESGSPLARDGADSQMRRAPREEAIEDGWSHDAAVQECGEARPRPPFVQLG